jgi:lysophospholipase L1-like esterase
MARSGRLIEYAVAAGLAVAAFAVSPIGIELAAGRSDLSFRVNVISLTCTFFLLAVIAAVLAQGRLRRVFFHVLAWLFPLVILAGLEAVALSVRLADIVAPLEDVSLLANKTPWPTFTNSSYYTTPEGFVLYRPFHRDGITFNALGLRTAMPTSKAPGEWRIAVTGGSTAWGWRVFEADTIPVRLQEILRRAGHGNITVYNFGIGGATLKQELALLKHFRETYAIDQVLFYTGGNDAILSYRDAANQRYGPWVGETIAFELIKTAVRLQAIWSEPSPQMLHWLDTEVLPAALKRNSLRVGIEAADAYCRSAKLLCDFALQPMMFERKTHSGAEERMAKTLAHVFPHIDGLANRMYAEAVAASPPGHVVDLSHIFDDTARPLFLDFVHLNEAGYAIVARHLAPIVTARLP